MLRRLEDGLPLTEALAGSILKDLGENVIPVINLGDYDPGSQPGVAAVGAADYGLYGALEALERGYDTLPIGGLPGKPEWTMVAPTGFVHQYVNITVKHDQGSNVDFFAQCEDVLVPTGLVDRWRHGIVTSAVETPLLRLDNQAKSVDDLGPGPYGPYLVYPLMKLVVSTSADMSSGKTAEIYWKREVYKTTKLPIDDSIAISAAVV